MSKRYRVAIVGTGRVGALWEADPPTGQSHAGAFMLQPDCELVAGANRGRERLEEFGRRFGVRGLYQDYDEMFRRERPEIVSVATHPGSHAAIVRSAVSHGARAIFIEKPIALDLADCDQIINDCRSNNVLLSVNHSRRWYPIFRHAHDLLQRGEIGDLISMTGYCQGGKPSPSWQSEYEGPLLHDATHLFDLMRLFAGDVAWVVATAKRRTHLAHPVEDESTALLQFQNGVSGVSLVNELTDYVRFELDLQGTKGMLCLGLDTFTIARSRLVSFEAARADTPGFEWQVLESEPLPETTSSPPFVLAARELVDALEGRAAISSTGEDGRASLEIIMAIYESQLRGNKLVELPLAGSTSPLLALARQQGWIASVN